MKTIRLFCLFAAALTGERIAEEINQSRRKDGSRSILYGEVARSAMNLARAAESVWNDRG